jgi:hypothetical protein
LGCPEWCSASRQLAIGSFPLPDRFQKAIVPRGSYELHRFPVPLVFVAILAVETLERVTREAVRAISTGVCGSQSRDAADLHLASGLVDISFAGVITQSAAKACAVY